MADVGGPCVCQSVSQSAGTEGGGSGHHQTVGPLLSRPTVGTQATSHHYTTLHSHTGSTREIYILTDSYRKDDCPGQSSDDKQTVKLSSVI